MDYISDRYLDADFMVHGYLFNPVEHIASGGVGMGGTATVVQQSEYAYSATGGAVLAGSATFAVAGEDEGRGGASCGGSAVVDGYGHVGTGGITLSGRAYGPGNHLATGGASFGGTAGVGLGYYATGGAVCGGSADVAEIEVYRNGYLPLDYVPEAYIAFYYLVAALQSIVASGGITVGGTADVSTSTEAGFSSGYIPDGYFTEDYFPIDYLPDQSETWVFVGAGGATTGGEAGVSVETETIEATGGITMGGIAGHLLEAYVTTYGGVTLGGAAAINEADYTWEAEGGITTGGAAEVFVTASYYEATGGITTGGSADYGSEVDRTFTGGGVTQTGGEAEVSWTLLYSATGGLTTAGAAEAIYAMQDTATGGVSCGGTVDIEIVVFAGIKMGGAAEYTWHLIYEGDGGAILLGTAPWGINPPVEELHGSIARSVVLSGGVQKVVNFTGTIKR